MKLSKWSKNQAFWDRKKNGYGFMAKTPKEPLIKPEPVEEVCGHLLRVPIDDHVYWAFKTADALDKFLFLYDGERIST